MLLDKYDKNYWGIKDPRLSITMPAWLPLLEELDSDVYMIAVFRKPSRVVSSIESLGQGGSVDREALVKEYNERTLMSVRWVLEF